MPAGNDGVYGPADNFLRRFKHLHGSYGEAVLRSSLSCCNAAYRHALNLFDITQRAQSALEVQPVQTARVDLKSGPRLWPWRPQWPLMPIRSSKAKGPKRDMQPCSQTRLHNRLCLSHRCLLSCTPHWQAGVCSHDVHWFQIVNHLVKCGRRPMIAISAKHAIVFCNIIKGPSDQLQLQNQ